MLAIISAPDNQYIIHNTNSCNVTKNKHLYSLAFLNVMLTIATLHPKDYLENILLIRHSVNTIVHHTSYKHLTYLFLIRDLTAIV